LVIAPPLVTEPAEVEYFLDCLERTLAKPPARLLGAFVRDKLVPWA
jgi:putrescine aminotransferase